jgi:hypothetical protein
MTKYKIIEKEKSFFISSKKSWWPFWRYLRTENRIVIKFDTRRKAQAYVNFKLNRKK